MSSVILNMDINYLMTTGIPAASQCSESVGAVHRAVKNFRGWLKLQIGVIYPELKNAFQQIKYSIPSIQCLYGANNTISQKQLLAAAFKLSLVEHIWQNVTAFDLLLFFPQELDEMIGSHLLSVLYTSILPGDSLKTGETATQYFPKFTSGKEAVETFPCKAKSRQCELQCFYTSY